MFRNATHTHRPLWNCCCPMTCRLGPLGPRPRPHRTHRNASPIASPGPSNSNSTTAGFTRGQYSASKQRCSSTSKEGGRGSRPPVGPASLPHTGYSPGWLASHVYASGIQQNNRYVIREILYNQYTRKCEHFGTRVGCSRASANGRFKLEQCLSPLAPKFSHIICNSSREKAGTN